MIGVMLQSDNEGSVCGGDHVGGVPFEIFGRAVPEIHALPEGVIAGIECPPISVKLIRKYQLVFFSVETSASLGFFRCLRIDQLRKVRAVRAETKLGRS